MSDALNLYGSSQLNTLTRKMSSATLFALENESENDSPINPQEAEEEMKCLEEVIMALKLYRVCSYDHLNKTENYINSLPKRQRNMLAKYQQHLSNLRNCIDKNQAVINKMLRDNVHMNEGVHKMPDGHRVQTRQQGLEKSSTQSNLQELHVDVQPFKIFKAQSILKLIARDWSAACAEERNQSYKPIIEAIEEFYKPEELEPNEIRILVPGAGVGRLTYELACRGYECEGNEFSYFMLIASNFILNQCKNPNSYTLYPWIHQYVNNLHAADQMTSIQFPDICMSQQQPKGKVTMIAGDFLLVYKIPNSYDCVATCFFMDCANNIIDFIETIYRILIPGGIWVNLGPLLYNYCDIIGENSIEPTYDQLIPIIETVGFEIVRTKTGVRTKYAQNPQSMQKSEYESVFWICRKPLDATDIANESSDESSNFEDGCEQENDDVFDRSRQQKHLNGFRHYYN